MRNRFSNYFILGNQFKKEFKQQIRSLIVITLGFGIAFSWRQTFFDLSESLVRWMFNLKDSATSSIITSVFITILSVFLIFLSSYWLSDRKRYKY